MLAARTLSILEAQYLLGHESITFTQTYLEKETDKRRIRSALREVNAIENSLNTQYLKMKPVRICRNIDQMF